jgi:hypothetical protein
MWGFVRFVLIIGLVFAVGSLGIGWWALPVLLGIVLAEGLVERRITGRAPPWRDEDFADRTRALMLFCIGVTAVFLLANWLFDGSAVFFAWMGTIFAFWVVACVIVPMRHARRLKTQR